MGCGCGGGGSPSLPAGNGGTAWMLVMPDGKKTTYSTETAARAANARAGGTGLVKKNT